MFKNTNGKKKLRQELTDIQSELGGLNLRTVKGAKRASERLDGDRHGWLYAAIASALDELPK